MADSGIDEEEKKISLDPSLEGTSETDTIVDITGASPATVDNGKVSAPLKADDSNVTENVTDSVDGASFSVAKQEITDVSNQDAPAISDEKEKAQEVDPHDKDAEVKSKEALTRTESAQSTLSQVSSVTVVSGDGSYNLSPLMTAIDEFDPKVVEDLLKAGADVKEIGDGERNAAHFLILTYCKLHPFDKMEVKPKLIEILHLLVQSGVDINAGEKKKQSPLHIAASYPGNGDIIKPLLASGSKVNLQDGQQRTALHYAVAKGDEENASALVEGGANPNIQDFNKQTPLHLAVKAKRNVSLVQFLLRCGAESNLSDRGLKTPLHVAAKAARPELVKELLEYGAQVNKTDSAGQTAIHLAAVYDISGRSLRELLARPADVNVADLVQRHTALHKAVALNMQDNIKILAKARANPNCQDILGETPLHRAYNVKEFNIWQQLIRLGGDIHVKNEGGHTPLFKAVKAKNDVALGVMRLHGLTD